MNNHTYTFNYYALQVKTRAEEKFIRLFNKQNPDISLSLHFPQRTLDIRRKGKVRKSTLPIFPGYIFLELEADENINHYYRPFRKTDGFFRFLRSNSNITPLRHKDHELILHFTKRIGPIAGKSKVYFNEDNRIVVLHGPLSGLEGKIIKVDRRKKRARVTLDLYDDSFAIDLAFEVIEKAVQNNA